MSIRDEWNGNQLYKWCQAHKHELPDFDSHIPEQNTDADYEAEAWLFGCSFAKYPTMTRTKNVHGQKNAYYASRKLANGIR